MSDPRPDAAGDLCAAAFGHWANDFVGLPWRDRGTARDGVACWGLAVLVYAECLGLAVPDYAADVVSTDERDQIAAAFSGGTSTGPWVAIDPAEARAFDILVFRRAGLDAHVGIVTEPGRMLHITAGQDSAIVDYTAGRWAPRLSAVYRHEMAALWGADGARDAAALAAALIDGRVSHAA